MKRSRDDRSTGGHGRQLQRPPPAATYHAFASSRKHLTLNGVDITAVPCKLGVGANFRITNASKVATEREQRTTSGALLHVDHSTSFTCDAKTLNRTACGRAVGVVCSRRYDSLEPDHIPVECFSPRSHRNCRRTRRGVTGQQRVIYKKMRPFDTTLNSIH